MLASFLALVGLPAKTRDDDVRVHRVLAPLANRPRGLGTSHPYKSALKRATVLSSGDDCQCWLWSDPHIETLGGDSADFMPHEDPVHTLVAKAGDYKIQSYHCPVVQATCQPDYYPCGASAATAFAGSFTDKNGLTHHAVFFLSLIHI